MVIVEKERLVEEVKENAEREVAELNEVLEENKRFLSFLDPCLTTALLLLVRVPERYHAEYHLDLF